MPGYACRGGGGSGPKRCTDNGAISELSGGDARASGASMPTVKAAIAMHIGAQANAPSWVLPISGQSPFIGGACALICGDAQASAPVDEPNTKNMASAAIRNRVRARRRNMLNI